MSYDPKKDDPLYNGEHSIGLFSHKENGRRGWRFSSRRSRSNGQSEENPIIRLEATWRDGRHRSYEGDEEVGDFLMDLFETWSGTTEPGTRYWVPKVAGSKVAPKTDEEVMQLAKSAYGVDFEDVFAAAEELNYVVFTNRKPTRAEDSEDAPAGDRRGERHFKPRDAHPVDSGHRERPTDT